jgi:ankyrin repeat protein
MPAFRSIGHWTLTVISAASLLAPAAMAAEEAITALVPLAEAPAKTESSALLQAARGRDWETVRALLASGADPADADDLGLTPLMAAAIAGHVPTIEALLAAGAPVQPCDARGRTALGYALALRHRAAIDTLLKSMDTLPAAEAGGDDLAAGALYAGDRELRETILRRLPGGLAWTLPARVLFAQALAARDTQLGPLLIAKYAGEPAASDQAQPLLAYAIIRGDLAQAGALLRFGADPDTVLRQPVDTAFRDLIASNYVRYYLDSTQGISMLMLAAGMKQTDCVKLLLEHGADRLASTTGKARLIALYFAAWADSPETIQALIPTAPGREELWIDVSLDEQRARFYRQYQLVLTTPISTGRAGFPTRPGEYIITDKKRHHRSSIYREASMPYFMRLSCRDFGLHEGHVTGRPASHGCIRLPGAIARRLFSEVPVGTWVSVRGHRGEAAATVSRQR